MNIRRIGAAAAAVSLALGLSACGSDDGGDGGNQLKVGIKFDQPGLGLKEGNEYTGFDVDVARYIAEKLGTAEDDIEWIQAPSAQVRRRPNRLRRCRPRCSPTWPPRSPRSARTRPRCSRPGPMPSHAPATTAA